MHPTENLETVPSLGDGTKAEQPSDSPRNRDSNRDAVHSRGQILKGGVALTTGQIAAKAFGFGSNVIVARLLTPADFGVAAMLGVTISFLEMLSDLSIGTMVIQSDHGDEPLFIGSVQSIMAIRGIVLAVLLLLLAWPLSALFNAVDARWAFECLALYPLAKGLLNQDVTRFQRKMRFGPSIWSEVGSQAIAMGLAYPLAAWLHSYAALLWLLIIEAAAYTAITHLVAKQPFQFSWNKRYIKSMFRFGWPLLISGVAIFVIFQGDAALIGSAPRIFKSAHYTKSDLGVYAVAFSLAQVPALMMTKVTASILLPALARVQHSDEQFNQFYRLGIEVLAVIAGISGICCILAGYTAIVLLYGMRYVGAAAFVGWLAAMQSVRLIRRAPTTAALARGDTHNSMICNLVRLVGFVGAIIIASQGGSLVWIAACGLIGELMALTASIWRIGRIHNVSPSLSAGPVFIALVGMGLAGCVSIMRGDAPSMVQSLMTSSIISMLFLGACVIVFPEIRKQGISIVTASLVKIFRKPLRNGSSI